MIVGMQVSVAQGPSVTSYAYKASLIGSAHRFELTDEGLSWHIAGRSGLWRYDGDLGVRLSFRPVSMQRTAFAPMSPDRRRPLLDPVDELADRGADGAAGQRIRDFILELHARMAKAGSRR